MFCLQIFVALARGDFFSRSWVREPAFPVTLVATVGSNRVLLGEGRRAVAMGIAACVGAAGASSMVVSTSIMVS